jgi:hypothetical protein
MRILASLSSVFVASLFPALLSAQGPNISGIWTSESTASLKWVIEQTPETIHIQEINGGKSEADFTCPLGGRVCDVKEDHRSEKVMIYFNAGKLVEIRERDGDASKEWLTVSPDGNTLTVETVPLSSSEKLNKTLFHRQSNVTS